MNLCERCEHEKVCKLRSVKIVACSNFFEIVECRYCKHRYVPHDCALWYGYCNGNDYFMERGDDFYCSFGKRKEGVDNG